MSCRLVGLVVVAGLVMSGCGTLEGGRLWGEDAWRPIDGARIARAARDAALSPQTLVPLAGAAVFAVDDFDERVSDWAVKHTPVFGAPEHARDASDDLRAALRYEAIGTAILTRSGGEAGRAAVSKLKGGSVELAAWAATKAATGLLKDATNRNRPDDSGDNSFPSGHTSDAFSYAALSNRNIDSIEMPDDLRPILKVTNVALASGVAWARVEGRRHYPSDVLFGAALGHFLTAFIHDAFLNLPEDAKADVAAGAVGDGVGITLSVRF